MFYSARFGILFIACPKTGSTSVESYLLNLDPEGQRFSLDYKGRRHTSKHVKSSSLGHATALEFRSLLGEQEFSALKVFGFVRDPREKLVSGYFFARRLSVWHSLVNTKGPKRLRNTLRIVTSILLARLLPFQVYVFVKPMKRCSDYFLDQDGMPLVDFLGSTERLGEDLVAILGMCGVGELKDIPPHLNRSSHKGADEYFTPFMNRFMHFRYLKDVELYEMLKGGVYVRDQMQDCRQQNPI